MPKPKKQNAIAASLGASHAFQPIKLNDEGLVDSSMLSSVSALFVGTSWPSSPVDGQLFFKTDLSQPELFFWSDGDSEWFSVRQIDYAFTLSAAAAGAQRLDVPGAGVTTSSTIDFGYRVNHDIVIQGVSFAADAVAASTINYVMQADGSPVAAGVQHSTSASDNYQTGLAIDVSGGAILGCRSTNSVPSKVVVVAHCRRRVAP